MDPYLPDDPAGDLQEITAFQSSVTSNSSSTRTLLSLKWKEGSSMELQSVTQKFLLRSRLCFETNDWILECRMQKLWELANDHLKHQPLTRRVYLARCCGHGSSTKTQDCHLPLEHSPQNLQNIFGLPFSPFYINYLVLATT
jgi:hypothetical protein